MHQNTHFKHLLFLTLSRSLSLSRYFNLIWRVFVQLDTWYPLLLSWYLSHCVNLEYYWMVISVLLADKNKVNEPPVLNFHVFSEWEFNCKHFQVIYASIPIKLKPTVFIHVKYHRIHWRIVNTSKYQWWKTNIKKNLRNKQDLL